MVAYAIIPVMALQVGWLEAPVPRSDLRRFVADRRDLWDAMAFNQKFGTFLRLKADAAQEAGYFRYAAQLQPIRDEVERLYAIYSAAAFGWPPDPPEPGKPLPAYDRREWANQRFTSFRALLGREAYMRGELPPVVPQQFFKEVDRGQVPVLPRGPVVREHGGEPDG